MSEKVKKYNGTVKPLDEKSQKWVKRLTILVAIWGILSFEFSSSLFGVIFILFAAAIWVSKNFMAIYTLGAVLCILAVIQLLNAAGFINAGFTVSAAQGTELIIVAIANFAVGGLIIYKTRKLE